MTIKQAIEKAIDGGYKSNRSFVYDLEKIVLDSSFWQALGKSMGWAEKQGECVECGTNTKKYTRMGLYGMSIECAKCEKETKTKEPTINYWHALIDHRDEGGSIESYFKKL